MKGLNTNMKEQNLVIENVKSFNLTHIFECGQCFRWKQNEDGSYTGIVRKNVINIKMINNDVYVSSYGDDDIVYLSIYNRDNDTYYDEKIKLSYDTRCENKEQIINISAKKMLTLIKQ